MNGVLRHAAWYLPRQNGVLIPMLLALAAPGGAQRAPAIRLASADATLAEEFSQVMSVRELRDGRWLVSDRRENRVVVADFTTGRVVAIARVGSGPGEFRQAGSLFAIAGDSTILEDPGARRWLLLDGDRVVATLPPDTPAVEFTGIMVGADSLGRTLGLYRAGLADSMRVVLVNRTTATSRPLERLLPITVTPGPRVEDSNNRYTVQRLRLSEWAVGEQALLFRDGWVAIARLNPYRIDWHAPDGRTIRGAPLPFVPTRVDDEEKRAFMARRARQTGRPAGSPDASRDWPATFPPFSAVASALTRNTAPSMLPGPTTALLAAADGRLLIDRVPTAARPDTHYDVVDRSGTLVGELSLPFNEAIVGFGAQSVLIVATDADGIQRLRRHPWP